MQQCHCNQSYVFAMLINYRETTCPSSPFKIIATTYMPNTSQGWGLEQVVRKFIRKLLFQINIKEQVKLDTCDRHALSML